MEKKKVQCPDGHHYDANKFDKCPTCNPDLIRGNPQSSSSGIKPSISGTSQGGQAAPNRVTKSGLLNKTSSIFSSQNNEPIYVEPDEEPYTAEPPAPVIYQQPSLKDEIDKVVNHGDTVEVRTVAVWNAPAGNEPVVGWLVCIKGEYIGMSFNIKAGNNSIGRAGDMDIHLALEMKVSRNKHCIITFEPENQECYLQQGESSGLTYLNGNVVMTPQKMADRDIIKIGDAEFIFVPFCIDGFRWETYFEQEM